MILVLIMYMLFASTFILGKAALEYVDPIFFIGFRMTIGGLLLLGYQYIFNRPRWRLDKKDWSLFGQIIIFHIFFAYTFEFWALQYVSGAKACLAYNLSPFLTALIGYFWFAEHMNVKKWLGLIIGFVGFLPIVLEKAPSEPRGILFISGPEIALFLSVLSAVYGWLVIKRLVKYRGYSAIMINGVGMFFGGLLAFVVSLGVEGMPALKVGTHHGMIAFVSYAFALILIANVIAYNMYAALLKRYSATFLSFAGFSTPLFAALFGWIFLSEPVSWQFFISLSIIFFGLYLFYQEELSLQEGI